MLRIPFPFAPRLLSLFVVTIFLLAACSNGQQQQQQQPGLPGPKAKWPPAARAGRPRRMPPDTMLSLTANYQISAAFGTMMEKEPENVQRMLRFGAVLPFGPKDFAHGLVSHNLVVQASADRLFVQAIDTGRGWLYCLNSDTDTICRVTVHVRKPHDWDSVLRCVVSRCRRPAIREAEGDVYFDRSHPAGQYWESWLHNRPVPHFRLRSTEGSWRNEQMLRGQPSLVAFWYLGCGFCEAEFHMLQKLRPALRQAGIRLFAFCADSGFAAPGGPQYYTRSYDPLSRSFTAQYESPDFPLPDEQFINAKTIAARFQVAGYPKLLLLDSDGIVRNVFSGWNPRMSGDILNGIQMLQKISFTGGPGSQHRREGSPGE